MQDKRQIAYSVLEYAEKMYGDMEEELKNWETPFQFLVCIVLSAQSTDKGVNKVTSVLFKKYSTPEELANANLEDVKDIVKSLNFFNNKSKNIVLLAKKLVDQFGSVVPNTVSELVQLAGVGQKTANVFLNHLYKGNEGIGVDTHVARVVSRLAITEYKWEGKNANNIAGDLERVYDKDDWHRINEALVLFGRYFCKAKNAKCKECELQKQCKYFATPI